METTPLTAHNLGQLLDHTFRMTFKNYRRFFLPVMLYSALSTALMEFMYAANSDFFNAVMISPDAAVDLFSSFNPGPYFLAITVMVLASPFFQYIVNDLAISSFFVREEEWNLPEAAGKASGRYVPMLLTTLLASLLIMAGAFALFVGAIVVALYLSLLYPILVFENLTPRETIRRAFNLVQKNFWAILANWIVFWLIFIGIDLINSRVVELIAPLIMGDAVGITTTIIYFILNLPVVVLTISLQCCFTVNLYFNQRIKKEGFGLE
ncbi:MAG: hypothetical protein PQJ59_04615 [Spirochaetales bacterium]|nr:hypothetical protein [Spirochaetales bacterium]